VVSSRQVSFLSESIWDLECTKRIGTGLSRILQISPVIILPRMIHTYILPPVTISSYIILAIYCFVKQNCCVCLTTSTYIKRQTQRHVEFELAFLLLERSKLEFALDRCNHDVAYEDWYVEMKSSKSRKIMAQPRLKNTDFKIRVLVLHTKFVKQNLFQSNVVERMPDPHSVKTTHCLLFLTAHSAHWQVHRLFIHL